MLRYLRVSNLAVVREVSIELAEGLTAVTGETGAGKSILVDALTLLLGARASADLVRTGAPAASVEGIFRVEGNVAANALLADLGLEPEDGEVVLRREVSASGKGRAFVNGALSPVAALRRLGVLLADVHGQHEHVRLLDPSSHIDLLDHFAGLGAVRAELAAAAKRLRELETALTDLTANAAESRRRADFLRFEIREIDEAKAAAGEDEELAAERRVRANQARVLELAEGGYQALYEAEGSVLERLALAARDLGELGGFEPKLAPLALQVEAARAAVEDTALVLRDYARDVPLDAVRLEEVEARLDTLGRLKAKYGPSLADVLTFAERARAELKTLVVSDAERSAMAAERERAIEAYAALAESASKTRRQAARKLESRVEEELAELAMEKTRFRVRIETVEDRHSPVAVGGKACAFSATGVDRVEFHVSTNVGEEPRPLERVASGGELSRLLLALRTVASDHEPARIEVFHGLEAGLGGRVAVFDEVDAGIGGRVAHVLAKKLQRLARGRQVLCVTHLPAVAAAAERHLAVRKEERRGRTEVTVEPLDRQARVEELARMIGGDAVTDAVRRHAEELLSLLARAGGVAAVAGGPPGPVDPAPA